MGIAWHPDAQGEFDADIDWYEARRTGLGDRFEAAIDEVVVALAHEKRKPGYWRDRLAST